MASLYRNGKKIPTWFWMAGVFLISLVLIIMVWWYYHQRIEALNKIIEK